MIIAPMLIMAVLSSGKVILCLFTVIPVIETHMRRVEGMARAMNYTTAYSRR